MSYNSRTRDLPSFNKPILTSLAGSTFRDTAQKNLARMSAEPGGAAGWPLKLIPEPTNKFDEDAIGIWVQFPEETTNHQLGYVRNADCFCTLCGATYERYQQKCCGCGESENTEYRDTDGRAIQRCGLATKLMRWARDIKGLRFCATVMEVTGGYGTKKNHGMNYRIDITTRIPK